MREVKCECGRNMVEPDYNGKGIVIKARLIKAIEGLGVMGVCPKCKRTLPLPANLFTKAVAKRS